MIFDDKFTSRGELGGREAAGLLWSSVTDFVHQNVPNLPSDYRVVTRIYANLKGLGDVCHRSGITERPDMLEDFARGFTGSKQLFDFVDVQLSRTQHGTSRLNKSRSVWARTVLMTSYVVSHYFHKGLRHHSSYVEIFKLHLYDCHCRQILFGCSHDNGYARLLEEVSEPSISNSITLLEGVPFERELAQLKTKYRTTRFEGLFRTTKINIYQQHYTQQPMQVQMQQPQQQPQHPSLTPRTNGLPPPPVQYQSPYQPTISRATSSSPSDTATLNPVMPTWASTAMTAPQVASPPPTPQPALPPPAMQVPRNRYGQRIDPVVQYDPNEVKRIKKLKMCNVHFLRNDCPYDPCTHDHHYKPNKNELATLRYVSRMTPCKFGSECDDLKCIYGHRCPSDQEGRKDCRWGENCRFDRELHGIDRTVVRTTKVGKK